MLYRKFRMLRGHYAKMTRGLFPKRIIRYAGLTEPPMCTSAYLANVRPDHISSSYWFRSKKCSEPGPDPGLIHPAPHLIPLDGIPPSRPRTDSA